MPYKEPRPQLNLKVTSEEYEALEFEAFRAGVSAHTYVRHLVLNRHQQPLSIEAARVRVYYQGREEWFDRQLDSFREAAFSVPVLKRRIQELEQQVRELAMAKSYPEMIDEALQRHFAAVKEPVEKPYPPDRYRNTPEVDS